MIFNTFEFLWTFPIILCIYLIIQKDKIRTYYPKLGNTFLLIVSYALYIKWNPAYSLILLGVTVVTYFAALRIEKYNAYRNKKFIIWTGVILATLPLLVFKYYNFLLSQFNDLFSLLGIEIGLPGLNLIVPLGLSFFSLQAIGYLIDVYLQRIEAEHNWWDYMLFVSFFPQIASGPISKAKDLLPQIKADREFSESRFVQGLKWILWGMFLKVVVADRLGLIVNDTYVHMLTEPGGTLFIASLFYSMQLYCDFAGYSFMALGVGELLGFELINNFKRPYFAVSVTDFWHRWHISLSTWLKDNVYIPLGGSRCSKFKNYRNILITFFISGIWHGANWTFILWGGLHGAVQVVEKIIGQQKCHYGKLGKVIKILITFLIVNFAWIFFRMPSLKDAIYVIGKIFTDFSVDINPWKICFLLSSIVIFKDLMDELEIKTMRFLHSGSVVIRWLTYLLLVFSIMVFGVYGGQFIYSGF